MSESGEHVVNSTDFNREQATHMERSPSDEGVDIEEDYEDVFANSLPDDYNDDDDDEEEEADEFESDHDTIDIEGSEYSERDMGSSEGESSGLISLMDENKSKGFDSLSGCDNESECKAQNKTTNTSHSHSLATALSDKRTEFSAVNSSYPSSERISGLESISPQRALTIMKQAAAGNSNGASSSFQEQQVKTKLLKSKSDASSNINSLVASLSGAQPPAVSSNATPVSKRSVPKVREDILERRQHTQDIVYVKCADIDDEQAVAQQQMSNSSNTQRSLQSPETSTEDHLNIPSRNATELLKSPRSACLSVSTSEAEDCASPNICKNTIVDHRDSLLNEIRTFDLHSVIPVLGSSQGDAALSTLIQPSQQDAYDEQLRKQGEAESSDEATSEYWTSLSHDYNLVNALSSRIESLLCPRLDSERETHLRQLQQIETKMESILRTIRMKIAEYKEPSVTKTIIQPSHQTASKNQPIVPTSIPPTPHHAGLKRPIAPGSSRLLFAAPPSSVLVIKKPGPAVSSDFYTLCQFLTQERGLTVYAEKSVIQSEFPDLACVLRPIDESRPSHNVDFCITLGGDGTVLHLNSIFPPHQPIPPVLSFSLGSLGFLTPFSFVKHRKLIDDVLNAHLKSVYVCSRMRLRCTVYRLPENEVHYKRHIWAVENSVDPSILPPYVSVANRNVQSHENEDGLSALSNASETQAGAEETPEKKIGDEVSPSTIRSRKPLVESKDLGIEFQRANPLNEVIVQRGLSTSVVLLDLFVDGELTTTVRADGLIVSTPTGSTGYNMSTGGPMLAPSAPAMVISPVCPHNLAFRPIVLCDSSLLRIRVHPEMPVGQAVYASFDGRTPTPLYAGDSIRVSMETIRLPSIVKTEFNTEWFKSIKSKLHWNPALIPPKLNHPTLPNTQHKN